jgi:hypothetical protein
MCTVCYHPNRLEIERDLLACPSAAAVAACHHLPLEDVKKHKARLQARIEHAQRQLEQMQLADSLARLNLLLEKTMKILAVAEDKDDMKFMLQAVREAERLTKMIHSLTLEQEDAGLFMETTDPGWAETGTTPGIQQRAREKVRLAIKISLRTPCAGNHLEDDLIPAPASPPTKPVPAARKGRAPSQPRLPVIPRPTTQGTATALQPLTDLEIAMAMETALAPPDFPGAAQDNRAAPN